MSRRRRGFDGLRQRPHPARNSNTEKRGAGLDVEAHPQARGSLRSESGAGHCKAHPPPQRCAATSHPLTNSPDAKSMSSLNATTHWRGRENAGLWLDSPPPEYHIRRKSRRGRFPCLLTESGVCPVRGEPKLNPTPSLTGSQKAQRRLRGSVNSAPL